MMECIYTPNLQEYIGSVEEMLLRMHTSSLMIGYVLNKGGNKMDIQLKVDHKGIAKGTVGWLAENADKVSIGHTSNGNRGAWLHLKNGNKAICLVLHDPYGIGLDHPQYDKLDTIDRYGDCGAPGIGIAVTDACWESIKALAEKIKELMERETAEESPLRLIVSSL